MLRKATATMFVAALFMALVASSSALAPRDTARMHAVLEDVMLDSVSRAHWAVEAAHLLGRPLPQVKEACELARTALAAAGDDLALEDAYHAAEIVRVVAAGAKGCGAGAASVSAALTAAAAAATTPKQLFYAARTAAALGGAKSGLDVQGLLDKAVAGLSDEDSLLGATLLVRAVAALSAHGTGGAAALKKAGETARQLVEQAEREDGTRSLDLGSLTTTSAAVLAWFELARASGGGGGKPAITGEQGAQFARFLESVKDTSSPGAIFGIIAAAHALSDNGTFRAVVVVPVHTVLSRGEGAAPAPLRVLVASAHGEPVAAGATVKVTSLVEAATGAAAAGFKGPAVAKAVAGQAGVFEASLGGGVAAGAYEALLSASAGSGGVVAVSEFAVAVRVTEPVRVAEAALRVGSQKVPGLRFPQAASEPVTVEMKEKLSMEFRLVAGADERAVLAHQVFARLTHAESKREVFFVAEADEERTYTFELEFGKSRSLRAIGGGDYQLDLLVGDPNFDAAVEWPVAQLSATLSRRAAPAGGAFPRIPAAYGERREIFHTFREPDSRPPAAVSLAFTGVVLTPVLLLLAGWARAGANVSDFPGEAGFGPAVAFHACLGGILVLFGLFWLRLNMFQTIGYLAIVGLGTFFSGHLVLGAMADKRVAESAKASKAN